MARCFPLPKRILPARVFAKGMIDFHSRILHPCYSTSRSKTSIIMVVFCNKPLQPQIHVFL